MNKFEIQPCLNLFCNTPIWYVCALVKQKTCAFQIKRQNGQTQSNILFV